MRAVDVLGAFLTGIIAIAAISLIVAPQSQVATIITSFGSATSGMVTAAKGG